MIGAVLCAVLAGLSVSASDYSLAAFFALTSIILCADEIIDAINGAKP